MAVNILNNILPEFNENVAMTEYSVLCEELMGIEGSY